MNKVAFSNKTMLNSQTNSQTFLFSCNFIYLSGFRKPYVHFHTRFYITFLHISTLATSLIFVNSPELNWIKQQNMTSKQRKSKGKQNCLRYIFRFSEVPTKQNCNILRIYCNATRACCCVSATIQLIQHNPSVSVLLTFPLLCDK